MKQILLTLLSFYQTIISPIKSQLLGTNFCRYSVSCSAYARETIQKEGVIKGGQKSLARLAHCHPFASNYESI